MQETAQFTVQPPAHIYQLAERHQLGQFHMLYRRRLHRFLLWFLPVWLTLGITILSYDGYMLFLNSHNLIVGLSIQFWGEVAHLIFVIIGFVLGALGVNPFWGFKKYLYILDKGLLYTNGKELEVIRWDEIEAIFWWKKRGISYICTKDGLKLNIVEEMEKPQEISTIVAGAVTEQLLPDVLARYQKRGKVSFGPLLVTREGITNFSKVASWEPGSEISWMEIEDVCFEKGKLSIQVNRKWKYWDEGIIQAHTIPNPTVCIALIRYILETRGRQKREVVHT